MRGRKNALVALLVLTLILTAALAASASVRMRVTGKRDRPAAIVYVPSRATLLATGYYAEALGVPPPPTYYGAHPGPVYYGNYPYNYYAPGYCPGVCGFSVFLSPPAYQYGHSPLDPPLPIVY